MIIYIKKDEIDSIIEKLESIEEKFWLNFKNFRSYDREAAAKEFEELYKFIWKLNSSDGKQVSVNI